MYNAYVVISDQKHKYIPNENVIYKFTFESFYEVNFLKVDLVTTIITDGKCCSQ